MVVAGGTRRRLQAVVAAVTEQEASRKKETLLGAWRGFVGDAAGRSVHFHVVESASLSPP